MTNSRENASLQAARNLARSSTAAGARADDELYGTYGMNNCQAHAEQSETRKAWAKSYAEPIGSPMAGRRRRVPRTIVSLSVSRCGPPARRRTPPPVGGGSCAVTAGRRSGKPFGSRFGRHGQRPKNLNKKDPYTNTEFTIHPICAHFRARPYRKRTAAADRSAVCRDPRAQPSAATSDTQQFRMHGIPEGSSCTRRPLPRQALCRIVPARIDWPASPSPFGALI